MTDRRGLLIACGEQAVAGALDALVPRYFGGMPLERLLLPGGAWWLAEAADATAGRFKRMVADRVTAVEAASAMLASPSVERVVIAGHQDCWWYRERFPGASPGELIRRVGADMYAGQDELVRLAKRKLPVRGVMLVRAGDGWEERDLF